MQHDLASMMLGEHCSEDQQDKKFCEKEAKCWIK